MGSGKKDIDGEEIDSYVKLLKDRFNIKVLPESRMRLGIRITRDRKEKTIKLDLEPYIKAALDRFGLSECKIALHLK